MPELDSVLTLSQRQLGVMKPRPVATLHVGGNAVIDSGFTVSAGGIALPNGSVTTAMLAPNAAQQYLGGFLQATSWGSSGTGWLETPIVAIVTTGGGILRIEASCNIYNNTAGSYTTFGIGWNGAVQQALGAMHHPVVNQQVPISFIFYTQPTAGVVRYAFFVQANGGITSIWNGVLSQLHVNEQKR